MLAVALGPTSPECRRCLFALRDFLLCFRPLLERKLIKANPDRGEATAMVMPDIVYGIAALACWSAESCA